MRVSLLSPPVLRPVADTSVTSVSVLLPLHPGDGTGPAHAAQPLLLLVVAGVGPPLHLGLLAAAVVTGAAARALVGRGILPPDVLAVLRVAGVGLLVVGPPGIRKGVVWTSPRQRFRVR